MPGDTCVVCGNKSVHDASASFHRFPKDPRRRGVWLRALGIAEDQLRDHSRVCCRHFPDGDATKEPLSNIGKRFASPIKGKLPRAKRAKAREAAKPVPELSSPQSPTLSLSRSITPSEEGHSELRDDTVTTSPVQPVIPSQSTEVMVSTALLARIDVLEAENDRLKASTSKPQVQFFRVEQIQNNDRLLRFYTGFASYVIFLAFFEFLGPVVHELNYWGSRQQPQQRHHSRKLDPMNQLFLLLVKLRRNLKGEDLAFRFGISASTVSRYLTTWICFLYHHLKELEWSPSVEQVMGTLPHSFREKFPMTYAIIDGSEIFIQTPSDLHLQSSTWSQYKHHNTAKFLIACTPNGAISYISPVFVGSISDVELTRNSGFLTTLQDKPGVSIMADRGFTIKDMLQELKIELNLPPFMEGRKQLPAGEVQEGRKIASLRIHVERAIGRLKHFGILSETIPLNLSRLTNQIVHVCAFLCNFQPALVPPPEATPESDVMEYIEGLTDSESDRYSDCEDL